MVTLVTGFPGSGKSYYAIDKIYNILSLNDDMSKNIDIVYTNINGVKFDYFPNSKIQFKKFNEADFYNYLIQLYTLFEINKNDDSVDDKLIELSKEKGYHNALIVFDECHDFFSNQDKYKIFWLTYHRHLYHEIILLTQNKTLINSKYRAIPEIFVEAQPRSKKISSSTLTYKKFSSFSMRKTDLFDKQTLKTRQEVFNLYQSGNKSNQKSIITKYLKLIVIFVFIVFFGFYYIITSYITEPTPIKKEPITKNISTIENNNQTKPKQDKKEIKPIITNNDLVIKLICDNKKGCIYNDNIYPIFYINSFIIKTQSKTLFKDVFFRNTQINHNLYNHYILTSLKSLSSFFIVPEIKKDTPKPLNTNVDFEAITSKVSL